MTDKTRQHRTNRVFKSLHKPLTYLGVERTLFYFVCVGAVGAFNLFNSILAGIAVFIGGFAIGFKGNYMMFPVTDFDNYMAWYLIHNYMEFDPTAGLMVSDPDPDSDAKADDLEAAMKAIHAQD